MPLPQPQQRTATPNENFKRTVFLKLSEGQHMIRFLNTLEEVKLAYTHWIRNSSIECLGEDCPICRSNQEMIASAGSFKEAKNVPGFNPWQLRYYANILDRTPVKVSPTSERGFENKRDSAGQWPLVCQDSGAPLDTIEVTKSNTVKVLSGGKTIFNAIEAIALNTFSEVDDQGFPVVLDVTSYDIVLSVSGTGRERITTPISQVNSNDVIELALELHDLDKALIKLEAPEIEDLLRGVTLRDIFAARRVISDEVAPNVETTAVATAEQSVASVSEEIASLLN